MHVLVLSLICLGSGLFPAAAPSEPGWPQWRGPTHDGISPETDIADRWPDSGPPLLWARDIGQGYSAFIAVGDRIYTQTQTLYEQQVICLSADTGQQIWSYRYGWPYEGGGLYPGPRATPTYYRERVYFAGPDGSVGCVNALNGSLVWAKNPKQEFHGRGTDFGCACSPLIVDGKVIVPVGGVGASVVALDAQTGTTAWKAGDAEASYCTPVPIIFQGKQHVVTFLENSLAAFDVTSGQRLWNREFSQGYDEHAAAPLYREPDLLVASPFRSGAKLFRIGSPSDMQPEWKTRLVWDNPKFSNDVASSVLVDGYVYGFDLRDIQSRLNRPSRGEFRCLEFATGKVQWSTDKVGQANIIVADGKLILFGDNGELILARVNPTRYTELTRTTVFHDEVCWTPAALHRGRLYLRTQNQAVCLYLGAKPLQSTQPTASVAEIKTVRRFNPARLLGGEREFPATTPEWDEFLLWYEWSLAGLGCACVCGLTAFLLTGAGRWLARFISRRTAAVVPAQTSPWQGGDVSWRIGFWLTALACGLGGSAMLNAGREDYVFSWPLALWAILQLTLMTISWCERQPDKRRARWWSRAAGLTLIGVSALYFHLCRTLGLSIEWAYLIGYLLAFPVAALCARFLSARNRWWAVSDPVLACLSFSAYFWACAWFMKWWLTVGS